MFLTMSTCDFFLQGDGVEGRQVGLVGQLADVRVGQGAELVPQLLDLRKRGDMNRKGWRGRWRWRGFEGQRARARACAP